MSIGWEQKGIGDPLGAGLLIKACTQLAFLKQLSLGLWSSGYISGGNNNLEWTEVKTASSLGPLARLIGVLWEKQPGVWRALAHQLAFCGGCSSGKDFNPEVPISLRVILAGRRSGPTAPLLPWRLGSDFNTSNVAGFFFQWRPSNQKHSARDVPACRSQEHHVHAPVVTNGKQWLLQNRASSPQAWGILRTTDPSHHSFRRGIYRRANWSALAPRPPPCRAFLSQSNLVTTSLNACSFHPRIT